MSLIEWDLSGSFGEQIKIPQEQADLTAQAGISIEDGRNVAIRITNMGNGSEHTTRLKITKNCCLSLTDAAQGFLQDAARIRVRIL